MRKRRDGLCHKCNEQGLGPQGFCSKHSEEMMIKIDHGREAYEAELAREPVYRVNGKPRPKWDDLPLSAQEAWRIRAKHDA